MALEILELEEQFGRFWHRLVGGRASWPRFPAAAVSLESERRRLAVLFRAMGGDPGLELAAGAPRTRRHRLRLVQRLGTGEERLLTAERTAELVLLPPVLDCLPEAGLNRELYLWLVAFLAAAPAAGREGGDDPLRRDVAFLRAAALTTARVLAAFPGLRERHRRLAAALLALRPARRLRGVEAEVERAVRMLHGAAGGAGPVASLVTDPAASPLDGPRAPSGYRPFLASPLWGEVRPEAPAGAAPRADAEPGEPASDEEEQERGRRRARRRKFSAARGPDPLALINKGEMLLLRTEAVDISRPDDDEDDPEAARKAARDMDELALGRPDQRRAASRVRMGLDLPAEAAASGAPLAARLTYPEWDYRRRAYLPRHCAVLAGPATESGEDWRPDPADRRRIGLVRRRFEALRPRRELLRAQLDGGEYDTDALVRSRADLRAGGYASDRVHLAARNRARDLAIAILVDSSLSTDSQVEGRRVLDVEKAALTAFAFGLEACGDAFAILTFSSRHRHEVRVGTVKGFAEPLGELVRRRIAALRPGAYTRLGAALRHASAQLEARPERHRLLLLLSDGKPNDLDHYDGRYGIEDTRKAVREGRAKGQAVFAVTIDRRAEGYVPYLFGRGGYAIIARPGRLPEALPAIYRQLVG